MLARAALLLGLLVLPHQAMLHTLMPADLAGKNLWLILPLALALMGMVAVVLRAGKPAADGQLLVAALLWVAGIWCGLYWPVGSVAEVFVNTRPLFMMSLALMAGAAISRDHRLTRWFLWLLVAQGLAQAIIGIVHVHLFPQVVTGTFAYLRGVVFFVTDECRLFTSREAGTLGNPSAYAEMIGLGAFACCYYVGRPGRFLHAARHWFLFWGLWLVFIMAVMPSLSRLALVFVSAPFLLVVAGFASERRIRRRQLLLLGVAMPMLLACVVLIQYPQLLDRFRIEGMYGRMQKNESLFSTLTSDLAYFSYGLPADLVRSLRTPEGMGFGDNSFLRLAAATGVPVFCGWIAWLAAGWLRIQREQQVVDPLRLQRLALLAYLVALLYLGDVLFNDGWILMAGMLLAVRPAWAAGDGGDLGAKLACTARI